PLVPVHVARLLELAVEAFDRLPDGRRGQAGGGGVEVDPALERGEVAPDLVPHGGHDEAFSHGGAALPRGATLALSRAGVAKLAYARDSKSRASHGACGVDPHLPHH